MRGMTLPHRIVGVALLLTTGWFLAACASRPHTARPAALPVAVTSPYVIPTDLPTITDTPTTASPAETCQALTDMDVLKATEGFVIAGSAVGPGDVTDTVTSLDSIRQQADPVFTTALSNIIDALQALDTAVTDGLGASVDMSAVEPDSNLLAGMCRSRGATPQY